MNRLSSVEASSLNITSPWTSHLSLGSSTLASPDKKRRRPWRDEDSRHALFAPIHYESRYAYPLLVWLHDDGGSEREIRRLMPHVSVRNYVGASVRGVESCGARRGYAWSETSEAIAEAAQRVRECVELARERYNVHSERVFIAGFGRGGTMALRLALAHPEWFGGAASLSGPMPRGNCPLRRVNAARRLPLFLATCRDSTEYSPAHVATDLRLLYSAGFSLSLRQYPCDFELTTAMLSDMDCWLMGLVCPSTDNAAAS